MKPSRRLFINVCLTLTLAGLSLCWMSGVGLAETPTELYKSARARCNALLRAPREAQTKEAWDRCVEQIQQVVQADADRKYVDKCLFLLGLSYQRLYEIYRAPRDCHAAVGFFQTIVQDHPRSEFREPAEFRAATLAGQSDPARERSDAASEAAPAPPIKDEKPPAGQSAPQQSRQDASRVEAHSNSGSISPPASRSGRLLKVKQWSTQDYTRVVLYLDGPAGFEDHTLPPEPREQLPERVYIDIDNCLLGPGLARGIGIKGGFLQRIRIGQNSPTKVRVVLDTRSLESYKAFSMDNPFRVVVDVRGKKPPSPPPPPATPAPAPISSPLQTASAPAPAAPEPMPQAQQPAPPAPPVQEVTQAVPEKPPESSPATRDSSDPREHPAPALTPDSISEPASPQQVPASASPPVSAPAPGPETAEKAVKGIEPAGSAAMVRAAIPKASLPSVRPDVGADPKVSPPPASAPVRQPGKKTRRVVIDPGHGGKDKGASSNGIHEKNVTLTIARELKKVLEEAGYEVILTRASDRFISLEERTAMANTQQADLFVSIHTNAHEDRSLHGMETYYLSLSQDKEAQRVAALENATSARSASDLDAILSDLTMNAKINESSILAGVVQQGLIRSIQKDYDKVRDLGVKKAPFYVLMGATMPSILVETAFITNKREAKLLRDKSFQRSVAVGISTGIGAYMRQMEHQIAKSGEQ